MSSVEGYCILIYCGCTLIFSKVCFTCSENRLTLPLLRLIAYMKTVHSSIYKLVLIATVAVTPTRFIYLFPCHTALERGSPLWRCRRRCLHWKLSFRQLTVQPVTRVPLGWRPFSFSEPPYIIVTMARCVRGGSQWDQLNLTVTSLCVSCRSHCYLFACYYYFMLRLCILCYLCRTIALVATVICWLYPTLNKFYPILSYLILSYLILS